MLARKAGFPHFGFASLLHMIRFHAHQFIRLAKVLDRIALLNVEMPGAPPKPEFVLDDGVKENWLRDLSEWFDQFEELGLRLSAKTVRRAMGEVAHDIGNKRLAFLLRDLHDRLEDELEDSVIYSLTPTRSAFLKKDLFDLESAHKFLPAHSDIEEAGKCLAMNRNTAAVFHLMRVMEVGVRALGASLNDASLDPKTNPSWEKILNRGDRELMKHLADRSPEWRTDESFFSTAQANLRSVKDAWRNSTMHVERSYNDEEAGEIFVAVKGFVRHLASKLGS